MTADDGPIDLSVVLACLNASETIEEQLEALAAQQWERPWELIVADNGSTDESLALVARYEDRLPEVRVVDASASRGQAFALNRGAEAARGEFLVFCDADDIVDVGWLEAIGEAVTRHDFVAGRLSLERLNEPWAAVGRDGIQTDSLQTGRYPPYLSHAGSGTLAVRRSIHTLHRGFDESALALFDTDYCYRLQLAGTKLHFEPRAVVHYRARSSFRGVYRQMRGYAENDAWLQARYGRPENGRRVWAWPFLYWRAILRCLPRVHTSEGRSRLAWLLGWQVGRLRGSVKHRVLAV